MFIYFNILLLFFSLKTHFMCKSIKHENSFGCKVNIGGTLFEEISNFLLLQNGKFRLHHWMLNKNLNILLIGKKGNFL